MTYLRGVVGGSSVTRPGLGNSRTACDRGGSSMHRSSQEQRRVRRTAAVAVAALALTAAGAGVAGVAVGQPRPQAGVQPAAVHNGAQSTTRTHVRLVGRTSSALAAHARFAPRGLRQPLPVLVPHKGGGTTAGTSVAPQVQSSRVAAAAATVLNKFDGINGVQNDNTAFPLEPPDEGLGAGNGYVANFVNVTGAFYNQAGNMLGKPFYLNTFFKEDPATNTSDPRVFYDSGSKRWYATMLEYQLNSSFSRI